MRQPGGKAGVSDRLVSSIDFGPTALKLAGLKIPNHMQGRSFIHGQPRDYVYGARDRMDERYDIIRSVRDKRYRYIRNYEPLKTYYQYMNTPEKGATMKEIRRVAAKGEMPPKAAKGGIKDVVSVSIAISPFSSASFSHLSISLSLLIK